jgi:hypothetical protein
MNPFLLHSENYTLELTGLVDTLWLGGQGPREESTMGRDAPTVCEGVPSRGSPFGAGVR